MSQPDQYQRWTITIPAGRHKGLITTSEFTFDVWIENLYPQEAAMRALIERAGVNAVMEYGSPPVAVSEEPHATARVTRKHGIVKCECGSSEFTYEESHPSARRQASNESGVLAFYSDFEWFDGDDDPGVVCQGCGLTVDLPDNVTLDWR